MNVSIVGAGPAGLLLAHHLLSGNRNVRLRIVERLGDPRTTSRPERSFVISLSARGQAHLKSIEGLWPAVRDKGVEVRQSGVYSAKHSRWNYIQRSPTAGSHTVLINRNDLCGALLDQLAIFSDRCEISFNRNCQGVDLAEKTIRLADVGDNMSLQPYDLLIGADGVHSVVRNALLRQPGFNFSQRSLDAVWKVIHIQRPPTFQPGTTYFFNTSGRSDLPTPPQLAGAAMPTLDDRLCLLMFWQRPPDSAADNPPGIESPGDFQRNLAEQWLPGLAITPEAAKVWFEQKPSRIVETRCNRYHDLAGQAILLGDAAHGISSALAQGCQAGLADATALATLLQQHPDDLPTVLTEFSRRQVREGHAITDLNAYLRPQARWLSTLFTLCSGLQMKLQRLAPRRGRPPLFAQLARPDIAYSEIAHHYRTWIKLIRWSNQANR
jgi:kynurenine 3-monooxygenase